MASVAQDTRPGFPDKQQGRGKADADKPGQYPHQATPAQRVHEEVDPSDRRGVIVTPVSGRFAVVVERRALFRQRFAAHLDQFDLDELQTIERFLSGIGRQTELEGASAG